MKITGFKKILLIGLSCFTFLALANRYSHLELFVQALHTIKNHHFSSISSEKLIRGAIRGMLLELDPHSQLLNLDEVESLKEEAYGEYYGLGLEVEKKDSSLIVLSVLKKSPAYKAGFMPGDKILKIADRLSENMTVYDFKQFFKKNTKKVYAIGVLRDNKILLLKASPRYLKNQSIQLKEIEKEFFYLKIYNFSNKTVFEINQALKNKKISAMILDLRNNPGGIFSQAIKVADLFLSKGLIVSYKTRSKKEVQTFKAHQSKNLGSFPLVVLVNEFSASSSEILAAALQDHKRALIIGRNTFGKGLTQEIFSLKNKYALSLSVGEYTRPSGKVINKKGIQADIVIPRTKESFKTQSNFKKDLAILQAVKVLKK